VLDNKLRAQFGTPIRKVSLPKYQDDGEVLQWLMLDNVPGSDFTRPAPRLQTRRERTDPHVCRNFDQHALQAAQRRHGCQPVDWCLTSVTL
jgi:hypothetical protein